MTICLKAYVTLWVEASYGKVLPFHVGGFWLCESGDLKYLIYVTSPNYMIEGSCNFMRGNMSLYVSMIVLV